MAEWYVDNTRTRVNWGTAVANGAAAIDIYRLVQDAGGETLRLWARAGQSVAAPGQQQAQALESGSAVPTATTPPAQVSNKITGTALKAGTVTATSLNLPSVAAAVAARPELTATYAPIKPNTAVLFGTSLEAQGDVGCDVLDPSSGSNVNGRGWLNWAKMYLGQRLDLISNAGVSGNTSTQMLARIQADVVALNPGWVFIGGPVNDAPSGISAATTIANMTAIYTALTGRKIVQLNLTPRDTYNTTQIRKDVSDVQEWLRNVHTIFPNVIVVDVWRLIADPTTGSPATGLTVDGTHWTEAGAQRVGQDVATRIAPLVLGHPKRSLGLLDPRNCLGNPSFATSGTGWSSITAAATTVTYPADDETPGNIAQIVVAANTDINEHAVRYLENLSNGRVSVGDVVQASARIRWSGLAPYTAAPYFSHPHLHMRFRNTGGTFVTEAYGAFVPSANYATVTGIPASGDVVIKTARYTIPAGVDRLYLDAGWMGLTDGTIKVSEVAVSRLA